MGSGSGRWLAADGGGGRRYPVGMLLLLACKTPAPIPEPEDTGEPEVVVDCSSMAELPVEPTRLSGFTTAEDFAFDTEGHFVSPDHNGNILKITIDGEFEVFSPNFGESAGMAYLPDGNLVVASPWRGNLEIIAPDGGRTTLIAGLSYPNGVTVDAEGFVYVAEHDAGQVRRVNPDSGASEVIATGLYNPNGLALGPGESTLFVNSFGGGTVHAIRRDGDGGWIGPELYGETPGDDGLEGGCLEAGAECFLADDIGIGTCGGEPLTCEEHVDTAACEGLSEGDACLTGALGESIESVCATPTAGGALFCPKVPGEVVTACVGQSSGSSCTALGVSRTCDPSWEGILICDITSWETAVFTACEDLSSGDDCVIVDYEGYAAGTCADPGHGSLYCASSLHSWYGGLDGMAADACGNVYVTEYVMGYIWRFSASGAEPELVAETGSYWIPNLHWGLGVGGWQRDVLYVQERDTDDVLALSLGVEGVPAAYMPE